MTSPKYLATIYYSQTKFTKEIKIYPYELDRIVNDTKNRKFYAILYDPYRPLLLRDFVTTDTFNFSIYRILNIYHIINPNVFVEVYRCN